MTNKAKPKTATNRTTPARAEVVDSLGIAKAQAAAFNEKEEQIKARVAAFGHGDYNGSKYRATVRDGEKETIPQEVLMRQLMKLMGKKYLPWLRRNTIRRKQTTVRVVSLVSP